MNPLFLPFTFRTQLRNFHLITHRVRAERVRLCIPRQLELDTVMEGGIEYALISVGCFQNFRFHWGASPVPYLHFNQITYRTYVRHHDKRCVYFFGTFLGTVPSFLIEGAIMRSAHLATIRTRGEERDGRSVFSCHAAGERGWITAFEAETIPSEPEDPDFQRFLTDRFHGFFLSHGGFLMDQMVSHRPMKPLSTRLLSGRFDFWERLGILSREEMPNALISLVEPEIDFTFFAPIPSSLLAQKRAISAPTHSLRRLIR